MEKIQSGSENKTGIFKQFCLWLSMRRPVSKRELLNHRYDLAMLIKYVNEIETLNRKEMMLIIKRMNAEKLIKDMKQDTNEQNSKMGLEYQ
jgi:hypothetical protein